MMKKLPLQKAFTLLEPGPVVLVTTADNGKQNILTLSWTMVMDFPPRFAFLTGSWNYSYKALKKTGECVIAIPAVDLAKKTVQNNHYTLKGDIDAKRAILITLANEFEPQRKELDKVNPSLSDDLFFCLII